MNLGISRNICRRVAVVGGKCADSYNDSIFNALHSPVPEDSLTSISDKITDVMVDKIGTIAKGEYDPEMACFRLKKSSHCFRFIPVIDPSILLSQNASVGSVCSFHACEKDEGLAPLVAASYLGDKLGVLHASEQEQVLRSNYRVIGERSDSNDAAVERVRLGVGTEDGWHDVSEAVKQTLSMVRFRPRIASPLIIAHALVKRDLDAAVFHIANPLLASINAFFLERAMVPKTTVTIDNVPLVVWGQSPF